jgi:hypothetical protein
MDLEVKKYVADVASVYSSQLNGQEEVTPAVLVHSARRDVALGCVHNVYLEVKSFSLLLLILFTVYSLHRNGLYCVEYRQDKIRYLCLLITRQ